MKSEKRWPLVILLILFSLGIVNLAINLEQDGDANFSSIDPHSAQVENIVNRHLSITSQKMMLEEERSRIDAAAAMPQVGDQLWPKSKKSEFESPQGVDLSGDSREDSVNEDLNRHSKEYGTYKSANSVIQNENYQKDKMEETRQSDQQKLAQEFIENARRHGYQVKLDDNYVVISVKKIQTREAFRVINPDGAGSE